MDPNYGRHRDSIVNFEEQLNDLLASESESTTKEDGTIVIPAHRLQHIIHNFTDDAGEPILSKEQEQQLLTILESIPDASVSAEMLLPLLLLRDEKRAEPRNSEDEGVRGRVSSREDEEEYSGGRSSSSDSTGTSRHHSRPPSRSGSGSVPQTPRPPSALDSSRRQRATPLSSNPPTSYNKRPAAPGRRKSDAGNRSDGESYAPPSAYGYRNAAPRHRAPSNPTSPSPGDFSDMMGSPTFRTPSRPGSRQGRFFSGSPTDERGYSSPDDTILSPAGFSNSLNSLPMPRRSDDSDDDEDESALGLVPERQTTASTVSMEPVDRVELLQRANNELQKKLQDAENTLQRTLTEHETELEELTNKIDELTTELQATKKEEKELRGKERTNTNQISTLENEIGKLNRQLDHSKTTYQSLQRQYQEQCAASEKYRDELRQRDRTIQTLTDAASMHDLEQNKFGREREALDLRITQLEDQLEEALTAHRELEEQKQENMMLKETIDRMRYDMDELRNSLASGLNGGGGGGSGASSRNNTISKSLGAELAKVAQDGDDSGSEEEGHESEEAGSETVVEEIDGSDEEDVVQTIIRRRRKVASKANRLEISQTFEETKEYSDSSTQYDPDMFLRGMSTQTDPEPSPPPRVIVATQTEPPPERHTIEIGTDPIEEEKPEERVFAEMEVQTEEPADEPEASISETPDTSVNIPSDSPPTYDQVTYEREVQSRVAIELRKHHRGLEAFRNRVVSEGLLEEWQAFKDESGLECGVIDEALDKATVVPRSQEGEEGSGEKKRGLGGRFARNIYNTYIYGRGASGPGEGSVSSRITQGAVIAGASALVIGASALAQMAFANSGFGPQYNFGVAGGPTYNDRVAWAGFNAMPGAAEGFAYYGGGHHGAGGDGAFWSFFGRAAERAARGLAGWPT
ncbi:hypothetical protein AAF712_005227 [Marasmius tenuissimus]|uniref:Uncharacterized protein n=1 Tax=Marasmius tenuissimus TaxID=585030 RepID=A0ABR3A1H3_9AGAR